MDEIDLIIFLFLSFMRKNEKENMKLPKNNNMQLIKERKNIENIRFEYLIKQMEFDTLIDILMVRCFYGNFFFCIILFC